MSLSRSSHLQIPIREIIMDAFLSLVIVIVLFSICICRQNAQWLKYQLIFLGETLKKSWQLLMWGQFRMKYYFLWSHISMFLQEKQMTRRIFSLSFSSYILIFFSSKSLFICCHHCAMCSKNGASTKSIFFFSLTFESKLSFWVDAHTVDEHVIRVHRVFTYYSPA